MMIFCSIAIAAFIIVAGSFLFGHDHDVDHDHDAGGDGGDGHEDATISIFSPKILATLLMGFGAAGAIAREYQMSYMIASLIGLGFGILLAALMYFALGIFYKQQASSLVPTSSAIGCTGRVTVSISQGGQGEVGVQVEGQYNSYLASAENGAPISKGQAVRVVRTMGSQLVVEPD